MAEATSSGSNRIRPLPPVPIPARDGLGGLLPAPPTSFIGREREIAAVAGMLKGDDVRLVTLTGPGGVGKTRLALQVARELATGFPDGVASVDLTPLSEPGFVAPVIAQAIGVREAGDRPLVERLGEMLRDRQLLLVLDNFEQVVGAAPLLVRLLSDSPSLKILVTSRVRLRVSGEHAFAVPPLALAEGDEAAPLPEVAMAAATRLFVDRAKAADSAFALTEANAPAVAAICRRLDGLPLAIELAAARVPLLPPDVMLTRLLSDAHARLPLLTGGPRDLPARQQTLWNAIAWSYDLLLPEEQMLFRRLAVFAGGFTLAAAENILGPDARDSVFGLVAALADASLVQRQEAAGGEPRFAMLETVRACGVEMLEAAGEEERARSAHAAFCLALAERDQQSMAWNEISAWFDALHAEDDNLRATLAWLERSGDVAGFLHLAGKLAWFWLYRSHRAEGRRWLERALAAAQETEAPAGDRAWALHGAALLSRSQNNVDEAAWLGEEALRIYRGLGEVWGTAVSLNLLGGLARSRGDLEAARAHGEEALALFEQLGMARWVARVRAHLGIVAHWRGDNGVAEPLLQTALAAHRELNDQIGTAITLHWLAAVAAGKGDYAAASAAERDSLAAAIAAGATEARVDGLAGIAAIAVGLGRMEAAARLFGAVGAHCERLGYRFEQPERERFERAAMTAREALGETAFESAETAGRALTIEESVAEASVIQPVAGPSAAPAPGGAAARYGLTGREIEVLRLLVHRRTDREIAGELFISPKTAGFHVANILGKLAVANRREAADLALREGLTAH